MKKGNIKEILTPAIVLFLISAICTGILAFTNSITVNKIEENNIKAEEDSMREVYPDAASFSEKKKINGVELYEALDNGGNVLGYIFTGKSKGYGGDVRFMTGISSDGLVTGVKELELNETAGLGMNARKSDFKEQYAGKTGEFTVVKSNPSENEIQALTGATITSKAVTEAVNQAVKSYKIAVGGVNNG